MEGPIKGDVVVLPFPFSDLSQSKKRPALVVASLEGEDIILAQITSAAKQNKYSLGLETRDFKRGSLKVASVIRTEKLFTAEKSLVLYTLGSVTDLKRKEVEKALIEIFTRDAVGSE